MTYEIHLGKSSKKGVTVTLDAPNPTGIPPHVALGVGDKKKRYAEHLGKCFNDNSRLLNFLAFIHKTGKEHGSINLIARNRFKVMQMECVRDFLTNHRETLDAILPYIFPDAGYKAKEPLKDISTFPHDLPSVVSDTGHKAQISENDMREIRELISQDQARSAKENAQPEEQLNLTYDSQEQGQGNA